MSKPIVLSVVILNYNTREELSACLAAIEAAEAAPPLEVIVVDNASTDGSAAMVREAFPGVRLIANARNAYFARGNNQGMAAAQGDYILLLNPDVTLPPEAPAGLVSVMAAAPDVGALGCRMVFPDGRPQRVCARFSAWADLLLMYTFLGMLLPGMRARRERRLWYDDWDRLSARAVEVIPNSCTLVRRAVLDEVGLLDERYKLYFTEEDWCRRVQRAGWRLSFTPAVSVAHIEGASTVQVAARARRLYFRDMLVFSRHYFGLLRTALLGLALLPTWAAMRFKQTI